LVIDAGSLDPDVTSPPDIWLMRDAHTRELLEVEQSGARWLVNLTIPSEDTAVVRVANPLDLAPDNLVGVPDLLLKSANYSRALQDANVAVGAPDYEVLAHEVQGIQETLRSDDVQRDEVRTALEMVAANLTMPVVRSRNAQTTWWNDRLAVCVAAAHEQISAAVDVLSDE
jgi:hypothetical protein